jgi:hypothetical protein
VTTTSAAASEAAAEDPLMLEDVSEAWRDDDLRGRGGCVGGAQQEKAGAVVLRI